MDIESTLLIPPLPTPTWTVVNEEHRQVEPGQGEAWAELSEVALREWVSEVDLLLKQKHVKLDEVEEAIDKWEREHHLDRGPHVQFFMPETWRHRVVNKAFRYHVMSTLEPWDQHDLQHGRVAVEYAATVRRAEEMLSRQYAIPELIPPQPTEYQRRERRAQGQQTHTPNLDLRYPWIYYPAAGNVFRPERGEKRSREPSFMVNEHREL